MITLCLVLAAITGVCCAAIALYYEQKIRNLP